MEQEFCSPILGTNPHRFKLYAVQIWLNNRSGLQLNDSRQDRTPEAFERSKQSTLDNLSFHFNIQKAESNKSPKEILIDNISTAIKEDELVLNIEFTLLPSKLAFSRMNLDLYFSDQLLNSITLGIPQGALMTDTFAFPLVLDMRGMSAEEYLIRVEMYEPWSDTEKIAFTFKEIIVDYIPKTRQSRLLKVPIVKSISGSNVSVIGSSQKNIYSGIQQGLKKETLSKRDNW